MRPIILICLQNAYGKGRLAAGWHPTYWLQEFLTSRSGKRLQHILPDNAAVHYCNVAPGIGSGAKSVLEPSHSHLRRALRRVKPDYVVACGKLAEEALIQVWDGNLVCIPHPASRVLTNSLLLQTKELLNCLIDYDFNDSLEPECFQYQDYLPYIVRLALRQRRGYVEVEELSVPNLIPKKRYPQKYTPKQKDKVLRLCEETELSYAEIGRRTGVGYTSVREWCLDAEIRFISYYYTEEQKKEVLRLCKQKLPLLTYAAIAGRTEVDKETIRKWCRGLNPKRKPGRPPKSLRRYYRRNADEDLRDLQRQAAIGDEDAAERLGKQLLRVGKIQLLEFTAPRGSLVGIEERQRAAEDAAILQEYGITQCWDCLKFTARFSECKAHLPGFYCLDCLVPCRGCPECGGSGTTKSYAPLSIYHLSGDEHLRDYELVDCVTCGGQGHQCSCGANAICQECRDQGKDCIPF